MFKKPFLLVAIVLSLLFLLTCSGILMHHNLASGITMSSDKFTSSNLPINEPSKQLNINTATVDELTLLPGIGEVLAERIVAYRIAHGPYTSIEELTNVTGIGSKTLDSIREYITIGDYYENSGC